MTTNPATPELSFSQAEAAEHIVGLQASARNIDDYIAGILTPDDVASSIEAHVRHIAVMSAMPHLSGHDMTPYRVAAERGVAWLATR